MLQNLAPSHEQTFPKKSVGEIQSKSSRQLSLLSAVSQDPLARETEFPAQMQP